MSGWVALSDQDGPVGQGPLIGQAELAQGSLVLEVAVPLPAAAVLVDQRLGHSLLSVFLAPDSGVGLVLRVGSRVLRAMVHGPFPQGAGTARITFGWDDRGWTLAYLPPDTDQEIRTRGAAVVALPVPLLDALCRGLGESRRHPALLWFGVTLQDSPPRQASWVGQRTLIATPSGLRPAGTLQGGDRVLTADRLVRPLRSVRKLELPARGRQAPVLLRAPYFSRMRDILVSADQCIVLAGAEVEYLFSTEAVLARAQHLTDGRSAYHDGRRMIAGTVSLDIGAPDLIAGEDLAFLSASHDRVLAPPPLPILRHYEAVPLLALLGRGNGRRAA